MHTTFISPSEHCPEQQHPTKYKTLLYIQFPAPLSNTHYDSKQKHLRVNPNAHPIQSQCEDKPHQTKNPLSLQAITSPNAVQSIFSTPCCERNEAFQARTMNPKY
ncbi:hypothetical protein M758_8G118500 [Ceratodon purpureus]|uniref:Uncharacterized protein n=1 Tax=Ceratodon purpureus TaxID=3225 RepID=A0A8T0H0C5_CERPU|nr:hypothetical protein KC19_8G122000 [Ceratodon purpureus]KAG0608602.1 hypothetical protein M758_8G118500 [Ceratodon purpureus]